MVGTRTHDHGNPSTMAKCILLINGPNLNLLGQREPELYGSTTLPQIEAAATQQAAAYGATLDVYQSNHEGNIIDAIHSARLKTDAIVINPGAFTYGTEIFPIIGLQLTCENSHTSVAIRDALLGVEIPFVEVYIKLLLLAILS